jgi:transposase-like protein
MLALRSLGQGNACRRSSRGRALRRWSFEEKARIVEASYAPDGSVCALARQHGIAQGLLFTWRWQACEDRLGGAEQAPMLVSVVTEPSRPCDARFEDASRLYIHWRHLDVWPMPGLKLLVGSSFL